MLVAVMLISQPQHSRTRQLAHAKTCNTSMSAELDWQQCAPADSAGAESATASRIFWCGHP